MMQNKDWFALYTKPRWEKKIDALLHQKGFESYCPLNKVKKQWSDRVKVVEEPLFKSYVFVKIAQQDLSNIRGVNGVVNFVYWLGKPAVIREAEIENIKKFLNEYEDVQIAPLSMEIGDQVLVTTGPLMDKSGTIKKVLKNRVELVIECLGYKLTANLPKTKLKKL
ncbi:UpxY family transcription antiterminator [Parasegetibacter sp. MAH-26]|uniref:UpxY family transcription antiterminator n=2 Tax=Pinibacter aurantiacus TaxID=2851599 RepID=A0A9E2SCF1_9BACT|nr:UpxY family transcription antiterminator [Pinibacter aurantiacus]